MRFALHTLPELFHFGDCRLHFSLDIPPRCGFVGVHLFGGITLFSIAILKFVLDTTAPIVLGGTATRLP